MLKKVLMILLYLQFNRIIKVIVYVYITSVSETQSNFNLVTNLNQNNLLVRIIFLMNLFINLTDSSEMIFFLECFFLSILCVLIKQGYLSVKFQMFLYGTDLIALYSIFLYLY